MEKKDDFPAPVSRAEPVAYVGYGGEGKPKTLLLKADLPVGTTLYATPVVQRKDTDEDSRACSECHGKGSVDVTHEPLRDGYTETFGQCCDSCQGTGKVAAHSAPNEGGSEPVAWLHDDPKRVDVIHTKVKDLLQKAGGHLHRPLDKTERYTIPLYAAPAPVASPAALTDYSYQQLFDAIAAATEVTPNIAHIAISVVDFRAALAASQAEKGESHE